MVSNSFIWIWYYFWKVLIIGKLKSDNSSSDTKYDDIPMDGEEKKIFDLVQNNTIINRDILNKNKDYLKNIESKYKEIYGDKGVKFCEEENKDENNNENENISENNNEQRDKRKRRGKVKFSSIVEYSRN